MRVVFVIVLTLMFSSCFEQPDCLLNNTNVLKIALKGKTTGKDTTVTFTSVRLLKAESVLYANAALGTLEVPVFTDDSVTTIVFNYALKTKLISDSLVLTYRNELRLISPDCGAYLYQHDLDVPKTNFPKTRVTTNVLLTTVKKNLEIFL